MSGREWKPGDLALISTSQPDDSWLGLVRVRRQAMSDALEFAYASGGYDMVGDLADGYSARPLVVIDPEDRQQIEQLRDLFDAEVIRQNDDPDPRDVTPAARGNALQAALRSLIEPPKPEEPTGRYAVVVDADEDEWVRVLSVHDGWLRTGGLPCDGQWTSYNEISVVRVLSEGVQ